MNNGSDKIFEELNSAEINDELLEIWSNEIKAESQPGYYDQTAELAKEDD